MGMDRKPHTALAKTVSAMTRTGVAMLELREAETISLGAQHHGAAVKALYLERFLQGRNAIGQQGRGVFQQDIALGRMPSIRIGRVKGKRIIGMGKTQKKEPVEAPCKYIKSTW